jgi:hypothetical protein
MRELFKRYMLGDTNGKKIFAGYYEAHDYKVIIIIAFVQLLLEEFYNYLFQFNQLVCFFIGLASIAFWILFVCPYFIHNFFRT